MKQIYKFASVALCIALVTCLARLWYREKFGDRFDPSSARDLKSLSQIADSAQPMIRALHNFYEANHRYPTKLSELSFRSKMENWSYDGRGQSFNLHRKLGWDPELRFEAADGTNRGWFYDPGDSSPETELSL